MIAVTGRYVDLNNQAVTDSYVQLTPVHEVTGGGYIIVGRTVRALIRNGVVDAAILADSADLSQPLYVRVVEVIHGSPPNEYVVRPQGTTLDLVTAPRVADPPRGELYVPASALAQPNGVATLGPDGLLAPAQRPAGSGGGAVTSVQGRTGAVVLTAADVSAYTASHVDELIAALSARIDALESGGSLPHPYPGSSLFPSITLFP
jgi:hypothetical protein